MGTGTGREPDPRASDAAKMLNLPLIYLLNCAGVDFPYQDQVYPNRRGGGTPFFRNAELNQLRHSGNRRHLRYKPGRRRIPQHFPDNPDRTQPG